MHDRLQPLTTEAAPSAPPSRTRQVAKGEPAGGRRQGVGPTPALCTLDTSESVDSPSAEAFSHFFRPAPPPHGPEERRGSPSALPRRPGGPRHPLSNAVALAGRIGTTLVMGGFGGIIAAEVIDAVRAGQFGWAFGASCAVAGGLICIWSVWRPAR